MSLKPLNLDEESIFAEEEFRVHVQYTIQRLLDVKKVSYEELAKLLHVPDSQVHEIFSSKCNLTLRMLGRIFQVLGEKVELSWGKAAPQIIVAAAEAAVDDWERGLKARENGDVLAVRNIQRVQQAVNAKREALESTQATIDTEIATPEEIEMFRRWSQNINKNAEVINRK